MTLEKKISYDHSITTEDFIQVRQIVRIIEDGKEISRRYHRHVVDPYSDDVTNEDTKTKMLKQTIENSAYYDEGDEDGKIKRKDRNKNEAV